MMTNKELFPLIESLQDGDMSVFDTLYYETKDIVYYTILQILKDKSLSEDIMQETYLKALEKIHSFSKKTSVKSWFTTIARNLAINEYNKRKREIQTNEIEDFFGHVDSASEKELIIRDLFKDLKDTEREILIYHVLGDLTFKEISKLLNIPQGTVRWKYRELIKKLQYERM